MWLQVALELVALVAMCVVMMAGLLAQVGSGRFLGRCLHGVQPHACMLAWPCKLCSHACMNEQASGTTSHSMLQVGHWTP